MRIFVDMDGVIATISLGKYDEAKPIQKNIDLVNRLHENGNEIIIWTSRGSKERIDWSETTKKQLNEWGVRYDKISFNKPHYDMLIEDKSFNPGEKSIDDQINYCRGLIY